MPVAPTATPDDAADMKRGIAIAVQRLFPPAIVSSLIERQSFVDMLELDIEATITVIDGAVTFHRSHFLAAIREARSASRGSAALTSKEGELFEVNLECEGDLDAIVLRGAERLIRLSSFSCLDEDPQKRAAGLAAELEENGIDEEAGRVWIERLRSRPLDDQDVHTLAEFLKAAPTVVARDIARELRSGEGTLDLFVPEAPLYYERLVGAAVGSRTLNEFARGEWQAHCARLVRWNFQKGLVQALGGAAQPDLSKAIDVSSAQREELELAFVAARDSGDRFSQVAAIELGLELLDDHPGLEAPIQSMVQSILDDDPADKGGRLRLTSSLFQFVDGEFASTGIFRDRPPFWRRLAAISQASLIERQLLRSGVVIEEFAAWANSARGELFYLQGLVDLRREPRWLPDFGTPDQLKLEFASRLFGAGMKMQNKLPPGRLRDLLIGESAGGAKSHMTSLLAYLPGPLEGGSVSPIALPADVVAELRDATGPLTERTFAGLINLALVYRLEEEHAQLVIDALRRTKYQLQIAAEDSKIESLLSGIAMIAAVTRSPELTKELRILTRVQRQRTGTTVPITSLIRIGFMAAASERELKPWSETVGDWLSEISFLDMNASTAEGLHRHVVILCRLVPELWRTCAPAEAAFAAAAGMAG
jgi:hypothetical protein